MKLYLISQTENDDYDTYDSAVVCAPDEETARMTDPATGNPITDEQWDYYRYNSWASTPNKVTVQFLGDACPDIKAGVICSSFNAG